MRLKNRALLAILTAGAVAIPTLLMSADAGRHRAAGSAPTTPTKANFSTAQVEFYLNDDGIAYIRPGLKVKVNSITIGTDRKPVVDFNLTDNFDNALDRLGKITPGPIAPSFILSVWNPVTREYAPLTTRSVTTPANSPRPGVTAIQAGTDSGGTFTDLEMGHGKYAFKTALPSGFDQTKTYTLGIYATRTLTDIIGKNYIANAEVDFRPDGQAVTDKWDEINQNTSCNNCHDPLSAHGGARQDVKLCVLCHNSATVDPDTGNTIDFKVLIHKIHDGDNLPSVKNGKPFQIIGFNQGVNDFSTVALPQDIRNCQNCHEGTDAKNKPSQSSVWFTTASRSACGSCHDDVDFTAATGAANAHTGGPQADDVACTKCHTPQTNQEFDASIKGAHVVPTKSAQLKGIKASIVSVSNAAPGKIPTVVFKLTNNDGTAIDGSKLTTFSPMQAGGNTSGTVNYSWSKRDNAVGKATFNAADGTTSYTFIDAIPADATGTYMFTADIRRTVALKRGDGQADVSVRESVINPIKYVNIGGGATAPRRIVVTLAQCNSCHDALSLHGGQRNTTEECVVCHNPTATATVTAGGAPESISFQRMIHRIHTGENMTQSYVIGTTSFNEVRFPGDRLDCAKCHTGNSQLLPLAVGAALVTTPRDYFSPQGPGTAACLGCHDNKDAAAHAYLNTTTFGGTTPAEACATCHGTGKDWDVAKVHAR